jgi:hypothetical protein
LLHCDGRKGAPMNKTAFTLGALAFSRLHPTSRRHAARPKQ